MLEIRDVCKTYKKGKREIKVIKNFSYQFEEGKIYLLKGSSGKGKTTLLSILGLLDKCDSGEIIFNDKPIHNLKGTERTNFINQKIGFVFQQYNLLEGLTVKENVLIHYLNEGNVYKKEYIEQVDKIIDELGLSERTDHYPREMSGGEQQRVGIARAMVKNPKIIILDEPVSNLDEENANNIIALIIDYIKNTDCITIVSCHTNHFDDVVDEIISM